MMHIEDNNDLAVSAMNNRELSMRNPEPKNQQLVNIFSVKYTEGEGQLQLCFVPENYSQMLSLAVNIFGPILLYANTGLGCHF